MVLVATQRTTTKIDRLNISREASSEGEFDVLGTGFTEVYDRTPFYWLNSLSPATFRVLKPIPMHIMFADDGYIASFLDANIHSSGDTEGEAIKNLSSLIVDAYEMLSSHDPRVLGPEPKRQLSVLKEFIRPTRCLTGMMHWLSPRSWALR